MEELLSEIQKLTSLVPKVNPFGSFDLDKLFVDVIDQKDDILTQLSKFSERFNEIRDFMSDPSKLLEDNPLAKRVREVLNVKDIIGPF